MRSFDPTQYQSAPNGPLTQDTLDRLTRLKDRSGMSYAALGEKLGISGTFLHNLMNKGANVGTQHVERIVGSIVAMENPDQAAEGTATTTGTLRHSFHLRPDLQIVIDLPTDFTEREAERLARFVQSLPVE
jgi:hypothetical protein